MVKHALVGSRLFARRTHPRILVALLLAGGSANVYRDLPKYGLGMGSIHAATRTLAEMGLLELEREPQLVARLTPRGARVAELLLQAAVLAEGEGLREERGGTIQGLVTRFSGGVGSSPHAPDSGELGQVRRVRVG
jgi:hypothetical protein